MSISTNISGATLKLFDDSLMKHKKEVLEQIWNEYLKEKSFALPSVNNPNCV